MHIKKKYCTNKKSIHIGGDVPGNLHIDALEQIYKQLFKPHRNGNDNCKISVLLPRTIFLASLFLGKLSDLHKNTTFNFYECFAKRFDEPFAKRSLNVIPNKGF